MPNTRLESGPAPDPHGRIEPDVTTGLRDRTVRSSQYANSSCVSVPVVTTTASAVSSCFSTSSVSAWNCSIE